VLRGVFLVIGVGLVEGLFFLCVGMCLGFVDEGFDDRYKIAGYHYEVVLEDADEIEEGVVAGDDTPGFDGGDVHLWKADEFAEFGLTEAAVAAGGGESAPEGGR